MNQSSSRPPPLVGESTKHYRADIDGLRAVAVVAVVGFHAFPGIAPGGFVGVDIFFVISGYLISKIIFESLSNNAFSYINFYSRRVRRIFPALAIVLCFCLLIGWLIMLPNDYAQLGKNVFGGAAFVSNLILWSEAGYFDYASELKPVLHLWSLGVEEQFYILYPLIVSLLWKVRTATRWLLFLLTLCSFALNVYMVGHDASMVFYSPLTRFWELSAGGLIALVQLKSSHSTRFSIQSVRNVMSVIGLGLLLIGIIIISRKSIFPGWWALLPVGGTAILIWSGPGAFINKYILSNRVLVWVGLISFPLYLWHWPLLTFARIDASEPLGRAIRILLVGMALLMAWLTYRFVELPIRRASFTKTRLLALSSLMSIIAIIGLGVNLSGGVPSRMPEFVQTLSALNFDVVKRNRVGTCFLLIGQIADNFSDCEDNKIANRQTALLLGDSHASHLYTGLIERFGNKLNIIQRTAAGCPPMFGSYSQKVSLLCDSYNRYAQALMTQYRPDIVILAANWLFYDLAELKHTIQLIKSQGVVTIYVIGPVPQWNDSLLTQLYRNYRKTGQTDVPTKLALGLNARTFEVDKEISQMAQAEGVHYISPLQLLCDSNGCLTKYDEALDAIMTWDYGHLTSGGSEYLVSKFPDFVD